MTHHITDEQIDQIAEQVGLVGPASRVGDCHAAAHRFARAVLALAAPAPQGQPVAWMWQHEETGRKGFVEAEQLAMGWEANNPRLKIISPLCTAPAVPSDVLSEMREFGKAKMAEFMGAHHMALVLSQKIKEWADKLTAAPTPPAHSKCLTCNGHGLIGGHMQDGSGYGEGCPGCNPEPAVPEDVARDAERYRWLREQEWFSGPLCVLRDPKRVLARGIGLGADCPSGGRLDAAIDTARAAEKGGA